MPVETVARSLSFINWVVVSSLAVGSLAAILLLTHRSESTRGYRGFTVFAAGGWAFLAWLADGALPIPSTDAPIQAATPEIDALRRLLLVLVACLATLWTLRIARGSDGRHVGLVTVVTAVAALIVAAVGWAPTPLVAVALALQLLILAAVTGGSFAAMILAHWYLVTPKLPEAPLLLLSRALGIGIGLFPVLGISTLLLAVIALVKRLNLAAIQLVNYLIYPLQLLLIIPFVRLGEALTGAARQPLSIEAGLGLLAEGVWNAVVTLWDAIVHAALGWLVVGPIGIYLLYRLLVPMLARAARSLKPGTDTTS